MSDRLYPGDKVTLLLPDHVVMVEVEIVTRTYFEVTLSSRGAKTYQSKWRMSEEGISWLRGYWLADSPEINACRTAQALAPKNATEAEKTDEARAAEMITSNPFSPIISELLGAQEKHDYFMKGVGIISPKSGK